MMKSVRSKTEIWLVLGERLNTWGPWEKAPDHWTKSTLHFLKLPCPTISGGKSRDPKGGIRAKKIIWNLLHPPDLVFNLWQKIGWFPPNQALWKDEGSSTMAIPKFLAPVSFLSQGLSMASWPPSVTGELLSPQLTLSPWHSKPTVIWWLFQELAYVQPTNHRWAVTAG